LGKTPIKAEAPVYTFGENTLVIERRGAEAVDNANGDGLGVDGAAGGDGRAIVLELAINLEGKVVGEGVIKAAAEGVDVGDGVQIKERAGGVGVAAVLVVDLIAAIEEIYVRAEATVEALHLEAEEDVLLRVYFAVIDGIGASNFGGGVKEVERLETDVTACGNAEVFAAVKTGEGACSGPEG
jgi:hypothetical protein